MRRFNAKHFLFVGGMFLLLFFYCEFLIYYITMSSCHYPEFGKGLAADPKTSEHPETLRVMFLADTHLLGSRQGHWFDKLRREWQMHRAFQTAMYYFRPEVIFFLGDIYDEGKWCDEYEFYRYRQRFSSLFATQEDQSVVVVAGNHDVGFHYAMNPYLVDRFQESFNIPKTGVQLLTLKGNHFVLVNSMAMHGDSCDICTKAHNDIIKLGKDFNCMEHSESCELQFPDAYSRPILLQHFPLYRVSDKDCKEPDGAQGKEKTDPFRPLWDCLSENATSVLLESIKPRLVLSGHTHHGCRTVHKLGSDANELIPEWSVSSFSWRNRNNPAFVLGLIRPHEFVLNKCYIPEENNVISTYKIGSFIIVLYAIITRRKFIRRF